MPRGRPRERRHERVPPLRGHLDQVDLFRVLTFAAVVAVHSFAFTNPPDSHVANGFAVVLHFTREAFFFLTGFVLVHAQRDRTLQVRRFWARRLRLIGIPYLVWSVLYWAFGLWLRPAAGRPGDQRPGLGRAGRARRVPPVLPDGLDPGLPGLPAAARAGPRLPPRAARPRGRAAGRTRSRSCTGCTTSRRPPGSPAGWPATPTCCCRPTCSGSCSGCSPRSTWTGRRPGSWPAPARSSPPASWPSPRASPGTRCRLSQGTPSVDTAASAVLQPVMVLDSLGVIAVLLVVSLRWGAGPAGPPARRPGPRAGARPRRSASTSSTPSCSTACWPWACTGPSRRSSRSRTRPSLAWVLTLAGSVVLVALFRRTPLSLPLTGRSRPRREGRRRPTPEPAPAAPVPAAAGGTP